jgi:tRNA threonylcarbamoyladenosine biosynthesis protein TsaE
MAKSSFVFEGEMAAGKTTFIKTLCELLGVRDVVSSPTFSIVNEYESANGTVYHFDFYRLKNVTRGI